MSGRFLAVIGTLAGVYIPPAVISIVCNVEGLRLACSQYAPRVQESVFRQQSEPLAFGQVAWRDDLEVTAVQGGDLVQVEPLG